MAKREQFGKLRKAVFNRALEDAGFYHCAPSLFTRRRGNQVHGIDFELLRGRGQFTASVAFSYEFLPSFFSYEPINEAALETQLDFPLRARVGGFVDGRDHWFATSGEEQELAGNLQFAAAKCVEVLDSHQSQWRDPNWFIERLTPEVLREQLDRQLGTTRGVDFVPRIWQLISPWLPEVLNLSYFLAVFSLRQGNLELSREYARIAAAYWQTMTSYFAVKTLLNSVGLPDVPINIERWTPKQRKEWLQPPLP